MRSARRKHFYKTIFLFIILLIYSHSLMLASSGSEKPVPSFLSKAESLRLSGKYEKALELLDNPSFKKTINNDPILESRHAMELILNFWDFGQVKDSEKAAKKALSIRGLNADERNRFEEILRVHLLYNAAKEQRLNSNFESSIKSFEEAITIAKKLGIADFELKCLRQMSLCYWDQNNLDDFYSLNEQAVSIARKLNNRKDEGICLNNIGIYFSKINNYAKALELYETALELARLSNNPQSENECLNNLGGLYQELGDYERALDIFFKAFSIDQQTFGRAYIAIDMNNIGVTYRKRGLHLGKKDDLRTALIYFEKCFALAEKSGDIKTALKIQNNIGTIYADLEDYAAAIYQYNKSLEISQRIGDKESTSAILNNLGTVYFNLGDYEESTKYCQMSIDLAQQINSRTVLWEAFLDIGNAYKRQAKFAEAKKSYQESISVIENIRSNIEFEELKASYFGSNKRLESYYNLLDLLANEYSQNRDLRTGNEAFEFLEKARARAFLDSLEVSQVDISQGIDIKLANREKQIDRELTTLYKKTLVPNLPKEQLNKVRRDIQYFEDELDKLKREIRSTSPAYADLKYPKIISLEEARKTLLDSRTAVIAFSVGRDNSYGFALTHNNFSIFPISARKLLQERVGNYLKIISDKDTKDFSIGESLFTELIDPAISPRIERLIIVPDDALHYLPFETLKNNTNGRWLIEDYAVSYAPSLSSLCEIIKRSKSRKEKRTKDLLAFGDPDYGQIGRLAKGISTSLDIFSEASLGRLEFSGIEVQQIAATIRADNKDIRILDQASEQELKKLPLRNYKIIHLAAHAIIDDQKPARSAIVLSINGDDREDGFVQMREIYNLRLNADLVSLSACQTGHGQYIRGEGIESLNRAFFYAGASAVLTSLWSINDQASAQLMARFYFHLQQGLSLMDALRAAKIEMLRSGAVSHPFYWGAFQLTGDAWRKPFAKSIFPSVALMLAIALVISFSIAWRICARGKRKP